MDVYRAVKRLSKLGFIEQELGSPIAFVAVEPEQALDILVDAKSSQVERLRSGKTHLKRTLESLELERPAKSDLAEDEELFVKVLSGEQVFRRLKSLITNSREEVMTVFSPKSLVLYDRIGIPELEQERIAEGVKIRAVTNITKENCREAAAYSKVVDLRHSDHCRLISGTRLWIVRFSCSRLRILLRVWEMRPHCGLTAMH